MAQYPIKMLKDENGTPFVPLVAPEAVKDGQGFNLQTVLGDKLEKTNIIAGNNVTLSVSGNDITINSQAGGATTNIIDNLDQSTGGVGVLDAHQGYVLKGMIPGVQNTLTSTSTTDALSAYQGYLLSNRVVPSGGTTGQVLKKKSNTDNDVEWSSIDLSNYVQKSGDSMTGKLTLYNDDSGGPVIEFPAVAGYTCDYYGNLKHKRDTTTDVLYLKSSDNTAKATFYWETGDIYTRGTLNIGSGRVYGSTVLYNNSEGSGGDITLSDSAANYTYIEIFYKDNDGYNYSTKIYQPNGKLVNLIAVQACGTGVNDRAYLKSRVVQISGTSISTYNGIHKQIHFTTTPTIAITEGTAYGAIYRVEGIK